MERVLDAPVLPYRLGESYALRWQGGQKLPGVDRDRCADLTTRFDHPHTGQVGPGGLCPKPLDRRCDPIPTCFHATMIPIDGCMVGVLDVGAPRVPRIVEKERHVFRERGGGSLRAKTYSAPRSTMVCAIAF